MTNIIPFIPPKEAEAQERYQDFLKWGSANLPEDSSSVGFPGTLLDNLSGDFLKAVKSYYLYRFITCSNPKTFVGNESYQLSPAFALLNRSMRDLKIESSFLNVNKNILDKCMLIAKEGKASIKTLSNRYTRLRQIQQFCVDQGFIPISGAWTYHIDGSQDKGVLVGEEGDRFRENRLPDMEALQALGEIFFKVSNSFLSQEGDSYLGDDLERKMDVVITSMVTILLCCPSRISEVLALSQHSLFEEDGKHYIRIQPAKGGTPIVKPVPNTMVDPCLRAFECLMRLSETARLLADANDYLDVDRQVKTQDALFVMLNKREKITKIKRQHISIFLSGGSYGPRAIKSIFNRHGYEDIEKFHSHQIRHLLNTLAQKVDMSQTLVAVWSGRRDINQNQEYNHMTLHDYKDQARQIEYVEEGFSKLIPITRAEFIKRRIIQGSIQKTDYGYCFHDYSQSPCHLLRDCLNCSEQACRKGDPALLPKLEQDLAESKIIVEQCKKDLEKSGVNRWLNYHQRRITVIEQMITVLHDPSVEEGALIYRHIDTWDRYDRIFGDTNNKSINPLPYESFKLPEGSPEDKAVGGHDLSEYL